MRVHPLLIGLVSFVHAAGMSSGTLYVSPQGHDGLLGEGTESKPFQTLGYALAAAGNRTDIAIKLLRGTYGSPLDRGIKLFETSSVRIFGESAEDVTVDLTVFGSPFLVRRHGHLEVADLTVRNGWGGSVLLIDRGGSLNVSRVDFHNNSSPYGGGAVSAFFQSGAVWLSNCGFFRNSDTAVLLLGSQIHIDRCMFNENTGAGAGAGGMVIQPLPGFPVPSISNCQFRRNVGQSGAMAAGVPLEVFNCSFWENVAVAGATGGGAIGLFVQESALATHSNIFNCTFGNNSAHLNGGAVLLEHSAIFVSCTFFHNTARSGGSLYFADGIRSSVVSHCSFVGNVVTESGGGGLHTFSLVRVEHSVFRGNTMTGAGYGGGAVYLGHGHVGSTLTDSQFVGNVAKSTGGAVYDDIGANITRCHFSENRVFALNGGGAAVYTNTISSQDLRISDSYFGNNSARAFGGAVLVSGFAVIANSVFVGNRAEDSNSQVGVGGAILVTVPSCNRPVFINSCQFRDNVALRGGGAIGALTPLVITDSEFNGNLARSPTEGVGGAVLFSLSVDLGLVSNSTFVNNSAGAGGAVNMQSAAKVEGCVFRSNHASNRQVGGGAISMIGATQQPQATSMQQSFIANSHFEGNTAEGSGGAMVIHTTLVQDCTFTSNAVFSDIAGGGALYVVRSGSESTSFLHCSFVNNSAPHAQGGVALVRQPTSFDGCVFLSNHAIQGGAVSNAVPVKFTGCSFGRNTAYPSHGSNLYAGAKVVLQTTSMCGSTAVASVACSQAHEIVAGVSFTVHSSEVFLPPCLVVPSASAPVVISDSSMTTTFYGSRCDRQPAVMYTQRHGHLPSLSAVTSISVTLFGAPGSGIAVSQPAPNTSTPSELTTKTEPVVQLIPEGTNNTTVTISNVKAVHCSDTCFPLFGVRVTPATQPGVPTSNFILKWRENGVSLSLHRSKVNTVGFPWAWSGAGSNTLLLIRLRDQLDNPFAQAVEFRVGGQIAECSNSQGHASVYVCSITFRQEGSFTVEVMHSDGGGRIGDLDDRIVVVSVGWPIGGVILIVVATFSVLLWTARKALKRRRKRIADQLLANYVDLQKGLSASSAGGKGDGGGASCLLDKSSLIEFSELDIRRDIAAGARGKVSLATWKGMSVAIKQLHQILEDGDRHAFIKELAMHRSLVHPNVVQLLGVCQEPLCLVMEFMSRGSLFACLQQTSIEMPWRLRLSCALDVARAMAFLHAKDILHRDLKSLNVLVNEDWRCKVADFDQSRADADTLTATVGTVLWSAPEVLEGKGEYGKAADVYSFGIVMFECWTREPPYEHLRQHPRPHILAGGRPVCPPSVGDPSPSYQHLMHRCWDTQPEVRPTFAGVVDELGWECQRVDTEEIAPDEDGQTQRGETVGWKRFWKSGRRRKEETAMTPLLSHLSE